MEKNFIDRLREVVESKLGDDERLVINVVNYLIQNTSYLDQIKEDNREDNIKAASYLMMRGVWEGSWKMTLPRSVNSVIGYYIAESKYDEQISIFIRHLIDPIDINQLSKINAWASKYLLNTVADFGASSYKVWVFLQQYEMFVSGKLDQCELPSEIMTEEDIVVFSEDEEKSIYTTFLVPIYRRSDHTRHVHGIAIVASGSSRYIVVIDEKNLTEEQLPSNLSDEERISELGMITFAMLRAKVVAESLNNDSALWKLLYENEQ